MVRWRGDKRRGVAIVGGVRTPMAKAGTALSTTPVTELARSAMQESLYRVGWPGARVDEVVLGNVCMPADAANPARVAAVQAGLPARVPAVTVQRNCASGMEAIAQAAMRIRMGEAQVVLAGGAESMSTIPLLLPDSAIGPMTALAKAKTWGQKVGAMMKLRPRHFAARSGLMLGLTDPLCRMIMGKTAEVLAHEFGVSREAQDGYALRSHQRASVAMRDGRFDEEMMALYVGARFTPVAEDIGPRADQSMAALGKLRPLFEKRDGTVTVGNACGVTDGAAAVLVMDAMLAEAEGLEVLGYVRHAVSVALAPHRMGLGPVFAVERLLRETGLTLGDVELLELNEAFAAQVLACARAFGSDAFAQRELGRETAVGEMDMDRMNVNGGAIALGHPVGASGARIVLTLLHEMKRRNVERGVATLCVGGGQGAAMLLERR